jgi:hypothetical protein
MLHSVLCMADENMIDVKTRRYVHQATLQISIYEILNKQ